jgi:hypothetical protein
MSSIKLHQWLIAGALLMLAASCSRNSHPTGPRYPTDRPAPRNGEVIYRPDGTIIVVPRRTETARLPPGQQKKIYGHRSAKVFAPGQQRKHRSSCDNQGRKRKHKHGRHHDYD